MIGTANAAAAAGHAAAGGGSIPQFQSAFFSSQAFWAAVSFLVLMALMVKYVIPAIGRVLDARAKQIADDLGHAERLRIAGEEALASYRHQLSQANETSAKIIDQARLDAKRQADLLAAQLDAELAKKRDVAVAEIEQLKRKAIAEIKEVVVEATILATERLIAKSVTKTDANRMVEDVIKKVQEESVRYQ